MRGRGTETTDEMSMGARGRSTPLVSSKARLEPKERRGRVPHTPASSCGAHQLPLTPTEQQPPYTWPAGSVGPLIYGLFSVRTGLPRCLLLLLFMEAVDDEPTPSDRFCHPSLVSPRRLGFGPCVWATHAYNKRTNQHVYWSSYNMSCVWASHIYYKIL